MRVISLLSFGACWFFQRRKRSRSGEDELLGNDAKPYTFSYAELRLATGDFDPSNKLGEGGFTIQKTFYLDLLNKIPVQWGVFQRLTTWDM
nr:probable LRR receptor-like serine/threonine-protein kinase At1g56140 isoform X1 [Spinacia oleracea]